jgi:hypothetical protein
LQSVANVTFYIYSIVLSRFFDELEILSLLTSELDRDNIELSSEIDFLEVLIKDATESYSPSQLQIANNKVDHYKNRAQAIKIKPEER